MAKSFKILINLLNDGTEYEYKKRNDRIILIWCGFGFGHLELQTTYSDVSSKVYYYKL